MVGVVPPPFHGQGIATKALFSADLAPIEKIIIEIRSSNELSEIGKPSFKKFFGILIVIAATWKAWLSDHPKVLYYTAGSGSWVPFLRDIMFLGLCRPLFPRTVIHYHSGDLAGFLTAHPLQRIIGRFIYGRGAWNIRLGAGCSAPDFGSEARLIDVPNGLNAPSPLQPRRHSDRFRIIFLGNLMESKGVLDLIEAVRIVASNSSRPLMLRLVGGFSDSATEAAIHKNLQSLPGHVHTPPPGPAYDAEKWAALTDSDVLVFPSRYSCENLPLVLIEAMAAGLPIIASNWRGIPTLVSNRENGFLVPVSDPKAIAEALETLMSDTSMCERMGLNSITRYQRSFTMEAHLDSMKKVLTSALASVR